MIWRYGSAILRDKANGDGGDNGGGGGGKAGEPFTPEQLTALGTIVGQTVNSAVTNHMSRNLGKGISEALKGLNWGEVLGPEIAKLAPKGDDSGGKGGGGTGADDGKGKAGGDPVLQQQLSKLAGELEKERQARQESDRLRLETENQRRVDQATTELRGLLQPKLRPELLDVFLRDLTVGQKRLTVGEDGKATLKVKKAPYKGAPEQDEDLPLAEAVQLLLEREETKAFLPAPGGGPGKRGGAPGTGGAGAPKTDSKDPLDRVAARLADLGMDFNNEFSG